MSRILATGLKAPPPHAPRRLATTADVLKLQRLMTHLLVRPLTKQDGLQPTWIDGRPTAAVAAEFIKSNDRLTSFERLQLYNRMYWFRLLDIMHDDNPGLRALLGEKKFTRLTEAYLAKYPSRSFTLRNLGSRLAQFIREQPRLTAPHTALAHAVTRFEWAQTVAFDEGAHPGLTAADLKRTPPARLKIALQPYLSLLALDWPVDDYVIAVKQRDALRGAASNAVDSARVVPRSRQVARPRRGRIYLGVHRYHHRLFYKRLERPAFLILTALAAGRPLASAVTAGGRGVKPAQVSGWFATWMELGWLCRR
ncbi:MAG: DNA-binding domain-containing protein [bacterium]|nr:DNA-binding domain-containing protein [bacterium]MDI1335372.1 DNA-binding domain-containing protein [Lacunisphaera sp.]